MRAVYRIVFMLAAFNNYSSRRSQIRADKFKVEIPGLRQKVRGRARAPGTLLTGRANKYHNSHCSRLFFPVRD